MTMQVIQHIELGSAQATIDFNSIPQTYTDLVLKFSLRSTNADVTDYLRSTFNGNTSGYTYRYLYGNGGLGAGVFSSSGSRSDNFGPVINGNNSTSSTFSNAEMYLPNYTAAVAKSISIDGAMDQNATESYPQIWANLWNNTAAITSISLFSGANLAAGSSATLYGVLKGSSNGVTVS